jgi:hypothetical protein
MKLFIILLLLSFNSFSFSIDDVSYDLKRLKRMRKIHNKIISKLVYNTAKKYDIDYKIILSILKLESNFEQSATNKYKCEEDNSCGDYSIAQINYKTWKDALDLDLHKLKSSNAYAIDKMGEILSIVKKRNKDDELWFLDYHSRNVLFQIRYLRLLEYSLKKVYYPICYDHKENLLRRAVTIYGWKKVLALYTKIPSVDPLIKY